MNTSSTLTSSSRRSFVKLLTTSAVGALTTQSTALSSILPSNDILPDLTKSKFGYHEWPEEDISRILKMLEWSTSSAIDFVKKRGVSAYSFGMDLKGLGRSNEGLEWFSTMISAFQESKYYMGKAWIHWTRQEIQQAKDGADFIFKMDPTQHARASTHYMMGMIHVHESSIETATEDFRESERLFCELGNNLGLYLANCGFTKAAIANEELDEAERFLQKALDFNRKAKNPYPLFWTNDLRTRIESLRSSSMEKMV